VYSRRGFLGFYVATVVIIVALLAISIALVERSYDDVAVDILAIQTMLYCLGYDNVLDLDGLDLDVEEAGGLLYVRLRVGAVEYVGVSNLSVACPMYEVEVGLVNSSNPLV